jgi:hypothetical protein
MPRPRPLPDLANVDVTELQLMILAVLDHHNVGPEFRRVMPGEFGDLLDRCGGARQVLEMALAATGAASSRGTSTEAAKAFRYPQRYPREHWKTKRLISLHNLADGT